MALLKYSSLATVTVDCMVLIKQRPFLYSTYQSGAKVTGGNILNIECQSDFCATLYIQEFCNTVIAKDGTCFDAIKICYGRCGKGIYINFKHKQGSQNFSQLVPLAYPSRGAGKEAADINEDLFLKNVSKVVLC
jgi:hypothetical protein